MEKIEFEDKLFDAIKKQMNTGHAKDNAQKRGKETA